MGFAIYYITIELSTYISSCPSNLPERGEHYFYYVFSDNFSCLRDRILIEAEKFFIPNLLPYHFTFTIPS